MSTVRIDSCIIAKMLLDFNQKILHQDFVTRKEVYEVSILCQVKLKEIGSDIIILDELNDKIFEERNGACFYVGDETKATIDSVFLSSNDFSTLVEVVNSLRNDILKCLCELREEQIKKIDGLI